MPLPRYQGGLRAGQITAMEPVEVAGVGTCQRLIFGSYSQATLVPEWVAQHDPQVGKYFVTDAKTAYCVPADEFDLVEES